MLIIIEREVKGTALSTQFFHKPKMHLIKLFIKTFDRAQKWIYTTL